MPNAVPGICQISVRSRPPSMIRRGREVLAEVGARDIKQRANEGASARIDAAEPGQSGASNQLQEKRLCLVVSRVADGDPAGVKVRAQRCRKAYRCARAASSMLRCSVAA
jgi:hypothetical protein